MATSTSSTWGGSVPLYHRRVRHRVEQEAGSHDQRDSSLIRFTRMLTNVLMEFRYTHLQTLLNK